MHMWHKFEDTFFLKANHFIIAISTSLSFYSSHYRQSFSNTKNMLLWKPPCEKMYLNLLTLIILCANSPVHKLIFFLFFPENRIRYFTQIVSPIYMECQILFPERTPKKNNKNIIKLLSAENFMQRAMCC